MEEMFGLPKEQMIEILVQQVAERNPAVADEFRQAALDVLDSDDVDINGSPSPEAQMKLIQLLLSTLDNREDIEAFGPGSLDSFVPMLMRSMVMIVMAAGWEKGKEIIQMVLDSAEGQEPIESANRTFLITEQARELRLLELEMEDV